MDIWCRMHRYLPYFELHLYDEGFVIQMPKKIRQDSRSAFQTTA